MKAKSDHEIIEASKSLEKLYQHMSKYDSVYYFNYQKHLAQHRLLKKISDKKHLAIQDNLQPENLLILISEADKIINKQRIKRNFFLIGIFILVLILYFFFLQTKCFQSKIENFEFRKEIKNIRIKTSTKSARNFGS